MKKLFILSAFLFFSFPAYSEDKYLVEKPDGSVIIVHYVGGISLEEVLKNQSLLGLPIKKIEDTDFPPRSDRKYYRMNKVPVGPKIEVDQLTKIEDMKNKQKKLDEIEASRKKICPSCTEDDWNKALTKP